MIYSLPPGAMTCSIAATAWIQIVELHQVIPPTFIASFTDPGGIWGSKSTCDWHCWATYAWKEYWIMRTLFMHNSASECDWCRCKQNHDADSAQFSPPASLPGPIYHESESHLTTCLQWMKTMYLLWLSRLSVWVGICQLTTAFNRDFPKVHWCSSITAFWIQVVQVELHHWTNFLR